MIVHLTGLATQVPGSVKSVFKAWEERLNSSGGHLESNEGDPELLIFIPFTSDVKINSISIIGGADGMSPSKIRAFINREGIDFSDAQGMQAIQEWDLVENNQGVLEYQTRYAKFQNVGSITLHFPHSFGSDITKIEYIGFENGAFVDQTSGPKKRTNDGLAIYTEDELGINKADAGSTPLCPFDCSCCF